MRDEASPQPAPPRPLRFLLAARLSIAILLATLYALVSVDNASIYDDYVIIIDAKPVTSAHVFMESFKHAKLDPMPYYRPVVMLSLWIQKTIHGLNSAPFHIFNAAVAGLLFYAASGLLLRPSFRLRHWWGLSLLPTASIIRQEVAFEERYIFMSVLAVTGVTAMCLGCVWERPPLRAPPCTTASLVCAVLLVISLSRAATFASSDVYDAHWQKTLSNSLRALHGVAQSRAKRGDHRGAVELLAQRGNLERSRQEPRAALESASATGRNDAATLMRKYLAQIP